MSKRSKTAEWADETEKSTLARVPAEFRKAKRNFLNSLSREEQLQLCKEIAETRAVELCRAYHNVVDVCFGYKRRRDPSSGKNRVLRTPSITFVVRSKWKTKRKSRDVLPGYLFSYWTVRKKRRLCAVPTDVEPASEFAAVRPHARDRVAVFDAQTGNGTFGAVTCAVRRKGDQQLFALSCRHVFSISDTLSSRAVTDAAVHLENLAGAIVARTTGIRGPLAPKPDVSFDAQLATVTPAAMGQFRLTMAGLNFSGTNSFAHGISDIPDRFWIVTPRTSRGTQIRVRAEKLRFVFDRGINYPGVGLVTHQMLLEAQLIDGATVEGDSGSPVVTHIGGETLLGMFIGGTDTLFYIIPAWQLFAPANYGRPNESWALANP
jgi:hypothetical protein